LSARRGGFVREATAVFANIFVMTPKRPRKPAPTSLGKKTFGGGGNAPSFGSSFLKRRVDGEEKEAVLHPEGKAELHYESGLAVN